MAKKGKDDAPTANSVTNRDIIQRLNFLYQASVYLNTIPSSQQSTTSSSCAITKVSSTQKDVKTARKRRNKSLRNVTTASELSRSYIATMKSVGQKTTVKIDPGVKRTLCKGCDMTLIPGVTATVRVKKSPSHGHIMVYTCTGCNTSRRIPSPPTLRADSIAVNDQPSQSAPALVVSSTPRIDATSIPVDDSNMDVDTLTGNPDLDQKTNRSRKQARIPPLFARDAGHVVFCGNERLLDSDLGDGVYIT